MLGGPQPNKSRFPHFVVLTRLQKGAVIDATPFQMSYIAVFDQIHCEHYQILQVLTHWALGLQFGLVSKLNRDQTD